MAAHRSKVLFATALVIVVAAFAFFYRTDRPWPGPTAAPGPAPASLEEIARNLTRVLDEKTGPLIERLKTTGDRLAWASPARLAVRDPGVNKLLGQFATVRDQVFGGAVPAEVARALYLALQGLWQVEIDLAVVESRSPPVSSPYLSPAYGPVAAPPERSTTVLIVFCGHTPRDKIEPPWITENMQSAQAQARRVNKPPLREWYTMSLDRALKRPATRLIDSTSTDRIAAGDRGEPAFESGPILLNGRPEQPFITLSVRGLGPADRLEVLIGSDRAAPQRVAVVRDVVGASAGPAGTELHHRIDPRLVTGDPIRLGLRLVPALNPAARPEALVGLLGLSW